MKLPASMQSWQAWLNWFQPEQAQAVGATLLRLHSVLGDNWGRLQAGVDEPNGIDDLRQRGPYHRLLLSEWSLADELPDEFMRRAASGEHLFLSPRLETKKTDEKIIALFDSGPDQIGSARLVHIALWILIARRAQQFGMEFSWGVLDAPGVLHNADTPRMLKKLLNARTFKRATASQLGDWNDFLSGPALLNGERWLIAAANCDSLPLTHRVRVKRELGADIAVDISAGKARRKALIPLPEPQHSSKLLRGLFEHEVIDHLPKQTHEKISLKQPPVIGPNGEKVAVPLLGESAALIFPLRYKKKNQATLLPKKVQWMAQAELLCGVLTAKQFGGIIASKHHLFFWHLDGFRNVPRPPHEIFHAPPGVARWLPCALLNGGGRPHRLFVLDYSGNLVSWSGYDRSKHIRNDDPDTIDRGVLAIGRCDQDRLVYLRHRGQILELMLRHRTGTGSERLGHALVTKKPQKAFVSGKPAGNSWRGAWCVPYAAGNSDREHSTLWSIYENDESLDQASETQVSISPDWQVVGMVPSNKNPSDRYALVALREDKKNLALVTRTGSEVLYTSGVPISAVSVGNDCDLIACVTEDRQLVFLSQDGQALRPWSADGKEYRNG